MAEPSANPPFLVCGLPKSGTTFLQRTLNLHPQVSCPSEQAFGALGGFIERALKKYEGVLQLVDRRTGGQGASQLGASIQNEMLRATIVTLSRSFARGRPIHGLNDNSVFLQFERYSNLLGQPKIVGIIRNPVDTALSAWRHNLRLAREEPDKAAHHLAVIDNPKKTPEGFVEATLPNYRVMVDAFLDFAAANRNVLPVTYERLVVAKEEEFGRILGFLGADCGAEIMAKIIAGSSREAMARESSVPAFFGFGAGNWDRATVSREFRRAALEASITPRMKSIGYDVSALMLGH